MRRIASLKNWALARPATLAAIILLPMTATANDMPAEKIKWRHDFQNILNSASTNDKPVLLRFFARWCGPCRVMDSRVWPDARVTSAVNSAYIPIEIDIDGPGAAGIANRYKINAVPTIVILDRKGSEIARANFMSIEEALEFLKESNGQP